MRNDRSGRAFVFGRARFFTHNGRRFEDATDGAKRFARGLTRKRESESGDGDADGDFEQELRAVFGRLPEEPLPDLTGFEELLEFESPPGTYFDAFPISIMSQQSLATMNQLEGESRFDVRRFRPNLLVDIPDTDHPFPEQAWVGKTLSIGSVKLRIDMTCPRCSMTTHGFDDLPRDT